MPADPSQPSNRAGMLAIRVVLLAVALALVAWHTWPDGRLHVIFLETNGDAVLIQTPRGGHVLIDGGGDPAALTTALGRRLPFWRRTLDAVVLTSPDGARLPGQVATLARYHAEVALAPPVARRGATFDEWLRLLDEARTPVRNARAGDRIDLGGATLHVLGVGDGDEAGLLLRLDYGATSVVFDHAGGEADEEALLERGTRTTTLLAFPWQRDPDDEIVRTLRPQAIVFTDGSIADRPIERTLAERAIGGATPYHERIDGAIEWISDGRQAQIVTER